MRGFSWLYMRLSRRDRSGDNYNCATSRSMLAGSKGLEAIPHRCRATLGLTSDWQQHVECFGRFRTHDVPCILRTPRKPQESALTRQSNLHEGIRFTGVTGHAFQVLRYRTGGARQPSYVKFRHGFLRRSTRDAKPSRNISRWVVERALKSLRFSLENVTKVEGILVANVRSGQQPAARRGETYENTRKNTSGCCKSAVSVVVFSSSSICKILGTLTWEPFDNPSIQFAWSLRWWWYNTLNKT